MAVCLSGALTACNNDDSEGVGDAHLKNIGISVAETTKTGVKVEFTPSNGKSGYYCQVIEKSVFDSHVSDDAFIESVFDLFAQTAGPGDTALAEFIAQQMKTGTQTIPFDKLKPGTLYIVYAFGLTTGGKATSSLCKESFTTIVQSPSDNRITLDITQTTSNSATVVTSATNEDPYVLLIREAAAFEGKTDAEILEKVLETCTGEEFAEMTLIGNQTSLMNDLKPDTDYIALAFGYESGVATTGLTTRKFFTMPEHWTIGIKVAELTKNTVTVQYTPSSDKPTYYGIIIDKAYFDDFASDQEYIQDDIDFFKSLAEEAQKPLSEIITERTVKGEQHLPFKKLKPDTEYLAYAFGVNPDGTVTSGLFKEFFTTPKPEPSANRLALAVSRISIDGALIEATATNDDPYILDVWEASKLAGKTDEQIIETVQAAYSEEDLVGMTETGSAPLDVTGRLEAGTDYVALAFGYDSGFVTTELCKESFATKPGGWMECTFTFRQESFNCRMASYTVSASEANMPFYFSMLSAEELAAIGDTDKAICDFLLGKIQEEADGLGMTLEQALPYILFRDSKTENYSPLKPKSDYYLFAVGLSTKGEVITDVGRSGKITTSDVSVATVTFGTPVIDGRKVTVSITPGAGTPKWKGAGMGFSFTYMSDDDLYAHLLSEFVGENSESLSFSFFDYDDNVYFFAVGLDADGNPGQLVKLAVPVE